MRTTEPKNSFVLLELRRKVSCHTIQKNHLVLVKCIHIKKWRLRMEVLPKSGDRQPIDFVQAGAGDIGKKLLSPLAD